MHFNSWRGDWRKKQPETNKNWKNEIISFPSKFRYKWTQSNKANNINIRPIFVSNLKMLYKTQCKAKLRIMEALVINEKQLTLNELSFSMGERILKRVYNKNIKYSIWTFITCHIEWLEICSSEREKTGLKKKKFCNIVAYNIYHGCLWCM